MSTKRNTPMDFSEKSLLYCLYAAVLISFFYNIGNVPLYDLDEGAFAEATREMLERWRLYFDLLEWSASVRQAHINLLVSIA